MIELKLSTLEKSAALTLKLRGVSIRLELSLNYLKPVEVALKVIKLLVANWNSQLFTNFDFPKLVVLLK